MPKVFTLLLFLGFAINAFTQQKNEEYKSDTTNLQSEMWDNAPAAFRVSEIPASMVNESAVIIARSYVVINWVDERVVSDLHTVTIIHDRTIWHERIKVNDKAALEKYSAMEYAKGFSSSYTYGVIRLHDSTKNYFGAKVIKPDGTEAIVDKNEEVIINDESNTKKAKIAISQLQTGDILDYYIISDDVQEGRSAVKGPYAFYLADNYPILYYYARFQLSNETGVEYLNANGAPALKQSSGENGDIILGLAIRNIPKMNDSLFTSPFRQYPYIKLQYKFIANDEIFYTHFKRGVIKHGSLNNDLLKKFQQLYLEESTYLNLHSVNTIKDYFGETLKTKKTTPDSIIKELYNDYRYATFCDFPTNDIDVSNSINYNYANSVSNAIYFSEVLTSVGIKNTIYLVCSRYNNSLDNVITFSDFDALVKVTAVNDYWVAFDDIVTQLNEIPARFQGEKAITIEPQNGTADYITHYATVPVISDSGNVMSENISLHLDSSDKQLVQIDQTFKEGGALRHNDQKRLLLMEDMEAAFAKHLTTKNQTERLNYKKKKEHIADEYLTAFAKERNNSKNYFTDVITDYYDAAPKDLISYKIDEPALENDSTFFEFDCSFNMNNFVRKAGNNFIIEAGKLMGSLEKINDKDSTRSIDVYRECAATYNWDIIINVPENYKVKGVENFNKTITNETGSLNCTALNENSKIEIKVLLSYYHNFEQANKWSSLVHLMNATYNLSMQKLLFEKNAQ